MRLGVRRVGSRSGAEIQEKQNNKIKIKGAGGPFSAEGMRLDMDAWEKDQ